jgi:hypothetical protein
MINKIKGIVAVCFFVAFAATALSGCYREHLSREYGEKNRAYFGKQRVNDEAAKDAPQGLDSEESAIIHKNYRKNLGGAAAPSEKSDKMLVVDESK